jgi:transcriptional regulator with XRE-family HTH domain
MGETARFSLMAKTLASAKLLVNTPVGESLRRRDHVGMSNDTTPAERAKWATLAGRLKWALDMLGRREGKKVSARELSRRANLPSESHVGLMISGVVTDPAATTLQKLAAAVGVNLDWLSSGIGLPESSPEKRQISVSSDRVHDAMNSVASRLGYTDQEVETASASIRGLMGSASMTEEQAIEFLQKARIMIRDNSRALSEKPAKVAVTVIDDTDDLDGGVSAIKKLPSRRK